MAFFDATTMRFTLRVGLPALLTLAATVAIVLVSLGRMADDVNQVEARLTERSVDAAVRSDIRRLAETHKDYAQWDDVARYLYGTVDREWAFDNVFVSTGDRVLFDTLYLLDEDMQPVLAYRNGEAVATPLAEAFGPSVATLLAGLPRDGRTYAVRTGIVEGAFGLAAVAAGPAVPQSADFENPPARSRFLVMGKALDEAAVARLGEDYSIDGLHLVAPAAAGPLAHKLADPDGTVIGALAWAPAVMGSTARAEVSSAVLAMLALVGLTMGLLIALALRGWQEVRKREQSLDAALNNMGHGLCMFDPGHRLATFNQRFLDIFGIPLGRIAAGMSLAEVLDVARAADKDPEGALAAQRNLMADPASGPVITTLANDRIISIVHRPAADGGFVATFEDITERRLAEQRVAHLAHYDALTDLPNRVTFYERMEAALGHLHRGETLAVISLDLDHFKSVNDTLGHPIGDQLLQAAAGRMRSCVRGDDIVARLGGDEFAIVQTAVATPADTTALASRLIETVGGSYDIDGRQLVVGASIGIAIAPSDGREPDVLMKNADLALYRAKADGGGAYRFFEAGMDARMQTRRAIELDLRKAALKSEFDVFYQPIIDLRTGRITTCEALIRWRHPERGMVPPAEFIPIAEETGLIVPIGEWVLRHACAEAATWPGNVTLSVNLSPAQFKSRDLVPVIVSALATSGLPPKRLELEITELVLLQESEGAFAVLHKLRKLGIKIAMDDFGTGYSSLGYLRSFPFDKIKIDQSFIRDLPKKEESLAIVRAVVGMSSSLGITTTAEGVETKAELDTLTAEGCDEFQGYIFSQARPAVELKQLLAGPAPGAAARAADGPSAA